jgi:hypothetical protein
VSQPLPASIPSRGLPPGSATRGSSGFMPFPVTLTLPGSALSHVAVHASIAAVPPSLVTAPATIRHGPGPGTVLRLPAGTARAAVPLGSRLMNLAKLTAIAIAPAATVILAAGPASAATHSHTKQIGSCRASGDYATCVTSGSVNHPLALRVHATSGPAQSVTVYWDVTCSKGTGAGSESGDFTATTPISRSVRMNYRHPDNCILSADAQLATGGTLHLWLTARKR